MDCPGCGKFNSMTAERCDCGFEFPAASSAIERRERALNAAWDPRSLPAAPLPDSEPDVGTASTPAAEDKGSFFLGFLAGFFCGIVVLLLVLRRGKPDTRQGVYFGFGLQVVLILLTQAR